jgi:hypothetical protein
MPIDRERYPNDWKDVSTLQKRRAGNKCELCGLENYTTVLRGEKRTRIVLTVHHIDGNLLNNSYPNLIVLCQKCHLRLDLGKHIKNAKKTRNEQTMNETVFVEFWVNHHYGIGDIKSSSDLFYQIRDGYLTTQPDSDHDQKVCITIQET